jgi:nucleoside-diphosphate-sugar epimerase
MKKTILVTGGAGCIGSTLCRFLLEQGYTVRVLDSMLYDGKGLLAFLNHPNFHFRRGDVRKRADVEACLDSSVEAVIHLAAIVGDRPCDANPSLATETNVQGTAILAECARQMGTKRFIFASTCSNYGAADTSSAADENRPLNPLSLYAETKISCEKLLLEMQQPDFLPVVLRFATAYGVSGRTRFDLLVNSLTFEALSTDEILIYAGTDSWRPYLHVCDISRVLLIMLDAPASKVGGQVFNVGSDEQNYLKADIIDMIRSSIPSVRVKEKQSEADLRNYRVAFGKLHDLLGFRPTKQLMDGIQEIIHAIRNGFLTSADYEASNLSAITKLLGGSR